MASSNSATADHVDCTEVPASSSRTEGRPTAPTGVVPMSQTGPQPVAPHLDSDPPPDHAVRVPAVNPFSQLIQGFPNITTKAAPAYKVRSAPKDAIALLKADHEAVSQLFAEYEKTRSVSNKRALVAEICTALSVHAQVEEEIFYPAVQKALKDKLLIPEATVEHGGVKELVAQLAGADPDDKLYDAKVKVLSDYVKHHVKEEQTELFAMVKASSLNLVELGARMAARRHGLLTKAV